MNIIIKVPKDIQRLIGEMLHTHNLQRCLRELFKKFTWSNGNYLKSTAQWTAFNYRRVGDIAIYDDAVKVDDGGHGIVWRYCDGDGKFVATKHRIPKCYNYSSGLDDKSGYKKFSW